MGCRRFYCGMAEGVDLWCGEILLELKKTYDPHLEIYAVIPFLDQNKSMSDKNRIRYQSILEQSDTHVIIASRFQRTAFKMRNRFMIDSADALIAVWIPSHTYSGTAQTVRLAQKKQIPVFFVRP